MSPEVFEEGLEAAWRRSDELFALLPEEAWLARPIGLRHPLLFYVGHLPAFAWNQIGRGALGEEPLDPRLDLLFARGIDPEDESGAETERIPAWPAIAETLAYRDRVREAVRRRIPAVLGRPEDLLCAHGRVLTLVIEHERMHHETLLYMLAECPTALLRRPAAAPPPVDGEGRAGEPRWIPRGEVTIGAAWHEIPFGWDNEFEKFVAEVPPFAIDDLPVRNRDWLDFFRGSGNRDEFVPQSWIRGPGGQIAVKTVLGPVAFELAAGWPVQVSGAQARVYCARRGGRLPTEAELRRAAYTTPAGGERAYPWGDRPASPEMGNFGLHHWCPVPVGHTPAGASAWGVEELVGNGWEWTQTPFAPLPGFSAWARTYPGYSADFFDGAHDVVFGASWATDARLLRRSFRNWYRRSYPYPFTSFRVVREA